MSWDEIAFVNDNMQKFFDMIKKIIDKILAWFEKKAEEEGEAEG